MFHVRFPSFPFAQTLVAGDVVKSVRSSEYGTGFETRYILVHAASDVAVGDDEVVRFIDATVLVVKDSYGRTFDMSRLGKPHDDKVFEGLQSCDEDEALDALRCAVNDADTEMRAARSTLERAEYKWSSLEDFAQRTLYRASF